MTDAKRITQALVEDAPGKAMISDDAHLMILKMQEHHQANVDSLNTVVQQTDADIQIGEEGTKIDADSDLARGIRFGVQLALQALGDFPLRIVSDETAHEDHRE